MKVIFYSEKCQYCNNMLTYLDKNNLRSLFDLINIDVNVPPKEIDSVPTIIDTDITQQLKGKKAFEYLINIKYFNNPTNNIEYIKDLPENPIIPNDDKAFQSNIFNLEINKELNIELEKEIHIPNNISNNIPNKKLSTLLKLKRK